MGRSPWQDGRRAWERLNGWHQDEPSASPGHPDDGDGALAALGDIGLARRLLEQAERVAVRTARRHGKSWAEVATQLDVTRQSAWERWRDLDEPIAKLDPAHRQLVVAAARELARTPRRRATVRVPHIVGKSWSEARDVLFAEELIAVSPDPKGLPLMAPGWPDGVVTDQCPDSGGRVLPGTRVTLWLARGAGGGGGVREPRRPAPISRIGRALLPEPADDPPSDVVS